MFCDYHICQYYMLERNFIAIPAMYFYFPLGIKDDFKEKRFGCSSKLLFSSCCVIGYKRKTKTI